MKCIEREVTTLAICWQIKRKDGVTLAFTCADHDIYIGGQTYHSSLAATPSAVMSTTNLSVDNLEIEGILSSELIKEDDIKAGLYDHAEISVFVVDYTAPENSMINLRTGWLGEVQSNGNQFTPEVRGLLQAFTHNLGALYSPLCRAVFCDSKCGLDEAKYSYETSVEHVIGQTAFLIEKSANLDFYLSNGKVKFLTGLNKDCIMEMRNHTNDKIELMLPVAFAILPGDKLMLTAGCDKRIDTCIKKYNNAINFRGEPHVPIPEKLG